MQMESCAGAERAVGRSWGVRGCPWVMLQPPCGSEGVGETQKGKLGREDGQKLAQKGRKWGAVGGIGLREAN